MQPLHSTCEGPMRESSREYNPLAMTFRYLRNFVRDRNVASIAPTTRATVRRACRAIDFSSARVIVEYGPGGGVFTQHLLDNIRPDARVIAIEKNAEFAAALKRSLPDKRLSVVCDGVERISEILGSEGVSGVDAVISGVPFSFFSAQLRDKLVRDTWSSLVPDGLFIVYQVKPEGLRQLLASHFEVGKPKYEPFNLPPLCVFTARKAEPRPH